MSGGHSHSHGTGPVSGHAGGKHRWRLRLAFLLIASFALIELFYALTAGSLALLSDAGHMAADLVTLGAALVATRIATRPDLTGRRSYGSYRAEVFASLLAVIVMLGMSVYVVLAALSRLGDTVQVPSGALLVVGALGLLVNLVVMWVLHPGALESLNVKGAYLEVVADTAGSVGVVAAGVLVAVTGKSIWDTVIGLAIGAFVAVRGVGLGRQVFAVLGQHVPAGIEAAEVAADLAGITAVEEVHDLHLWTLTSGMNVATAHLVTADAADLHQVLDQARDLLRDRHGISHATLQLEPRDHRGCDEVGW